MPRPAVLILTALLLISHASLAAPAPLAARTADCGRSGALARARVLHDLTTKRPAELTLQRGHETLRSTFVVPSTSGLADDQFTTRLQVVIRFTRHSSGHRPNATADIQVAVNGRVSNLLDLAERGGRLEYSYTGLLTGSQKATASPVLSIDFENYAQIGAVKPGENTLSVTLGPGSGMLVESAVLGKRTGVAYTTARPKQLHVTMAETIRVSTGEVFEIPFRLTRSCERPDKPVIVAAASIKEAGMFTPVQTTATYPNIGTGRDGVLRGRAERVGTFYLQVTVRGGYNDQARFITVQADNPVKSRINLRIPLALLMLTTAGALFLLRARRVSPSPPR